MANKKSVAFFEAGSWYHRTKLLQKDVISTTIT